MDKLDKVLLIINSLSIGGAERLVVDIASSDNKKYDVLAIKETQTFYNKELIENTVNYSYLTKGTVYNPFLIFKIIPLLKKYNVIHIHLFPALYWVVLAKIISFSKIKLVYTEHNTDNRRRTNKIFQLLDHFIYSKLNFIGCISDNTEINLKKHFNEKIKVPIKTIPNGIDLNKFNTHLITSVNYDYFEDEDFVLIQISSFRSQKDQETLIRSLKYLPFKIKLLLVGEGDLLDYHKKLVNDLELDDRVKFLGIRNDIPQLLNYSDVNILSSHYEGFGLVAVEGMAMEKPVIASNVLGLAEVVKGAGLLFEAGNSLDLANKINQLYSNQNYYQSVARECFDRSKTYDILEMIKQYENIYTKIISA